MITLLYPAGCSSSGAAARLVCYTQFGCQTLAHCIGSNALSKRHLLSQVLPWHTGKIMGGIMTVNAYLTYVSSHELSREWNIFSAQIGSLDDEPPPPRPPSPGLDLPFPCPLLYLWLLEQLYTELHD